MKLNEIPRPAGRKKRQRKRLGRGDASGQGGTAGRGHKGQKARSGGYHKVGFEGGQMPIQRRLPKRGFTSNFRKSFAIVNLDQLDKLGANVEVTLETLLESGLLSKRLDGLKILGRGKITNPVKVKTHAISAGAKKQIEAAGGQVEVISG